MTRKELLLGRAFRVREDVVSRLSASKAPHAAVLAGGADLVWSDRLTRTAGRAWTRRDHPSSLPDRVELSWPVFALKENEHDFDETVIHELAHIARGRRGHDALWQHLARLAGGRGERLHQLKTMVRPKSSRLTGRVHRLVYRALAARRNLEVLEAMIEGEIG